MMPRCWNDFRSSTKVSSDVPGEFVGNVGGLLLHAARQAEPVKQTCGFECLLRPLIVRPPAPNDSIEHLLNRDDRLTPPPATLR
jgi:hypothetical protein